jgi:hypothetical protein
MKANAKGRRRNEAVAIKAASASQQSPRRGAARLRFLPFLRGARQTG